ISWLPEVSAGGIEGLELDRTEAVRKMHCKYRHQQDGDHRHCRERNECSEEDEQPSDNFDDDGQPAEEKRGRNAYRVQHIDEIFGPPGELGIAMLHEAKPDNQSKWNGIPPLRNWKRGDRKSANAGEQVHRSAPSINARV